ncbi:uncharacterized protein LOC131166625 [Malania oleifera]|uniref:uncharacterized protein LOC131166625 n=1 Tax=Malania oleifera TaxID=397392 RepID=UPI0025AE5B00|nr:uncharacterized protein LOC131166625 [Malania oleifera]
MEVTHLLFADDTIIFREDDPPHILNLRCILAGFEAVSGCKMGTFPITTLGYLSAPNSKIKDCETPSLKNLKKDRLDGRGISYQKLPRDLKEFKGGFSRKASRQIQISSCQMGHGKKPFRLGGLGLKSLHIFNKAPLGKWLWRFMIKKDHLWQGTIAVKYGLDSLESNIGSPRLTENHMV